MIKQLALGTVLGAMAFFVWNALAWMIIPWPGEPLQHFTSEDAIVAGDQGERAGPVRGRMFIASS